MAVLGPPRRILDGRLAIPWHRQERSMIRYLAELGLASLLKLDRATIASLITSSAERYGGDSALELDDFIKVLGTADRLELFWGLYGVFTKPRQELRRFPHQALAGTLLPRLRPPR